jgi:ATP-dependent Clp protease ATP-binding subunit ClpA
MEGGYMFLADGSLDLTRFSTRLSQEPNIFDLLVVKAVDTYHAVIEPSHFLLALLDIEGGFTQNAFTSRGYDLSEVREMVFQEIEIKNADVPLDLKLNERYCSPAVVAVLNEADTISQKLDGIPVEERHILAGVLKNLEPSVRELFDVANPLDLQEIIHELEEDISGSDTSQQFMIFEPETGKIKLDAFDESGQLFLDHLLEVTAETGFEKVNSTHIGIALLRLTEGITQRGFRLQQKDPESIATALRDGIKKPQQTTQLQELKEGNCWGNVARVFQRAGKIAGKDRQQGIGESQLLRALMDVDREGDFTTLLRRLGLNIRELQLHGERNKKIKIKKTIVPENPWENLHDRWHQAEAFLKERIIDQDHAIKVLIEKLAIATFGLREENKPVAVLLFAGPTGVGKTELASVLAEFIFGSRDAMIRYDMTEHMEAHSVSTFTGAPPGYVGYEKGGDLVNKVKEQPHSIVLLDEFEKAHTDVFNIFLQVFDNATLTDKKGTKAFFNNTIIIMTSNIGAIEAERVATVEARYVVYEEALKKRFAPEFRNRLNKVVIFKTLSSEACMKILELRIRERQYRWLTEKGISVEISPAAKEFCFIKGFVKDMGARELNRVLEDHLNASISLKIGNKEISKGDSVYIDVCDQKIITRVFK